MPSYSNIIEGFVRKATLPTSAGDESVEISLSNPETIRISFMENDAVVKSLEIDADFAFWLAQATCELHEFLGEKA